MTTLVRHRLCDAVSSHATEPGWAIVTCIDAVASFLP